MTAADALSNTRLPAFDLEDCLSAMHMYAAQAAAGSHGNWATWTCTAEVAGRLADEIERQASEIERLRTALWDCRGALWCVKTTLDEQIRNGGMTQLTRTVLAREVDHAEAAIKDAVQAHDDSGPKPEHAR